MHKTATVFPFHGMFFMKSWNKLKILQGINVGEVVHWCWLTCFHLLSLTFPSFVHFLGQFAILSNQQWTPDSAFFHVSKLCPRDIRGTLKTYALRSNSLNSCTDGKLPHCSYFNFKYNTSLPKRRTAKMKFDAVVYPWDWENVYWDAFVITMHCSHLIRQHCCTKSLILSPAKSAKCMYRDSHTIPLQGFSSITSLQAICSCVNINYKE